MPTTTYIPTKVLLHDPDTVTNPKSLYPVTGLNAIVAGVDSSSNAIYIATSDTNKIKYQYLEIVGSNGVITSGYLPMSFTDGGKIANTSLDIFTTEGDNLVIKSDLLPSFVDDVVSVPVITNISQATGNLVILQTTSDGITTYNFYKRGANNTYVAGGGEEGKIYISDANDGQGDGSIYRCVSGSTTVAIKISENPYAVASTKTNGVYLDTTNGTLTAKADKAATDAFGTVKINTEATNNVKLTVSDGVIAASAGLANAAAAGMVIAVGTNAEASAMTSAFGDTYIVPNVAYMSSFVSAFVPTVNKASYDIFGVVKITNNGNIDCTSGVLTVASAGASVNGVVKIVDTINTAAEGNSSKAVTQAGIVNYVAGQLANYQSALSDGDGIDITDNMVSVITSGAIVISSGAVSARNATTTDTGVVLITGDSSYIANGSSAVDGKPVAVNPVAVRDYVSAQIISSSYNLQIASPTVRGGFRTSASNTGLTMSTPTGDNIADVLKINTIAPLAITSNNELTVQSASYIREGAVIMQAIATASVDDTSNTAAKAYDVKQYVDTASGSAVSTAITSANSYTDSQVSATSAAAVSAANSYTDSQVSAAVISAGTIADTKITSAITSTITPAITAAASAAVTSAGTITDTKITSAITSTITPAITAAASAAVTSAGTITDTKITSAITSTITPAISTASAAAVSAANAYTDSQIASATVTLVNGNGIGVSGATVWVEKAAPLKFDDNDKLTVSTGGPVYIDTNNALNVSSASTTAGGIVQLVGTSAGLDDLTTNSGYVPTVAAVNSYVNGKISDQAAVSAGYAATSSATTPALGGVRVVTSGGIEVNSGNIYLHTADASYVGGVKTATTNTGIAVVNGVVQANTALPIYIDTNNKLNISAATTASAGVVTVKNTAANVSAAAGTAEVPNCTGVRDYVSTYVGSNATGKFTAGSGLAWNTGSTTLDAQTEAPIQITSDKITIQTAVGPTGSAALPSTALGAVYVRGTLRDIDTIDADETPAASVVPTESAVRTAMNALPYITYTVL